MKTTARIEFIKLKEIFQPISNELLIIDDIITSIYRNFDGQIMKQVFEVLINSPGKRIRPALLILSAHAALTHKNGTKMLDISLFRIAAAIELIHQGSLLHDDLLDCAVMRHGMKTVNAAWGNKTAIFLGDYVFARAFNLLALCGDQIVLNYLGDTVKMMCEGELIQIINRGNFSMSREYIMSIINQKTSSLFASSCYLGAMSVSEDERIREGMRKYGVNFGMAFQLIDDLRDIVDNCEKLGKYPLQDIQSGDITLPLHCLFNAIDTEKRDDLQKKLKFFTNNSKADKLSKICFDTGVFSEIVEVIEFHINEMKNALAILPNSDYKVSLCKLADYMNQIISKVLSF